MDKQAGLDDAAVRPQRGLAFCRREADKQVRLRRATRWTNAAGTSFLSQVESSIAREFAANHRNSEHRRDHRPSTHRSSPRLSPPRFRKPALSSLATSPRHRPCQTCTQAASAPPPAAPPPLRTASAFHPYLDPTTSSPRLVSGPPQILRP